MTILVLLYYLILSNCCIECCFFLFKFFRSSLDIKMKALFNRMPFSMNWQKLIQAKIPAKIKEIIFSTAMCFTSNFIQVLCSTHLYDTIVNKFFLPSNFLTFYRISISMGLLWITLIQGTFFQHGDLT